MSDDFEAQIKAIEEANAGESDVMEPGGQEDVAAKPEPDEGAKDDDTLELTDGDEAVDVPDDEEGGEEDPDAEPEEGKRRPRRSKPASERIAELTARLREAERKLEAKDDKTEPAKEPEAPKAEDFEFGEADPKYLDALTDYKIEKRDVERQKVDTARAEQQKVIDRIGAGVAKAEAEAKEKYEDFDDRIAEAIEARGGEALPPMLTVGIGISPVGADIIYRLATDDAASARLEKLARGGQATSKALALALGEIEGEYLTEGDDADLDMTDDHDMARMMGRMRARLAGRKAEAPAKDVPKDIPETQAPEPPEKRARGGAGRGKVPVDTDDMKAFMKEYGAGLGQ